MAINKDSNAYTFGFAIVMVIIVGTVLAIAAMSLKPFQDENVRKEKMQNILSALQISVERNEAEKKFNEIVKEQVVLDYNGNVKSSEQGSAFKIDVLKQYKSIAEAENRDYPLYICEKDAKKYYVIPMVGKGLWGPIWGYIALEEDGKTVYGASFDHKSETPGLGAEIKEKGFYSQFAGKKILDENNNYVSVKVIKPGSEPVSPYNVDGISGGTITSRGVGEMLQRTLKVYSNYLKNKS